MSDPITAIKTPVRLKYTITAGKHRTIFLNGIMNQKIIGGVCPETGKVYAYTLPVSGQTPPIIFWFIMPLRKIVRCLPAVIVYFNRTGVLMAVIGSLMWCLRKKTSNVCHESYARIGFMTDIRCFLPETPHE